MRVVKSAAFHQEDELAHYSSGYSSAKQMSPEFPKQVSSTDSPFASTSTRTIRQGTEARSRSSLRAPRWHLDVCYQRLLHSLLSPPVPRELDILRGKWRIPACVITLPSMGCAPSSGDAETPQLRLRESPAT